MGIPKSLLLIVLVCLLYVYQKVAIFFLAIHFLPFQSDTSAKRSTMQAPDLQSICVELDPVCNSFLGLLCRFSILLRVLFFFFSVSLSSSYRTVRCISTHPPICPSYHIDYTNAIIISPDLPCAPVSDSHDIACE